jgi:HlyD family secretion protein
VSRCSISTRTRRDIDVVRADAPALVRLIYKGTVDYLSADHLVDKHTNQPDYAAKIRVDEAKLKELADVEMIPGRPAEMMDRDGQDNGGKVCSVAGAPQLSSRVP